MAGITKRQIERARHDVARGAKASVVLPDGGGLTLAIGRAAERWRLDYKVPLAAGGWSGGRRLILGDLVDLDLDAAREAARDAKAKVADGIDPVAAKKAARRSNIVASASQTVAAAIDSFTEERSPDWTAATCNTYRGDLARIRAELGDVPMALIERGRLVAFVDQFLADQRNAGNSGVSRAVRLANLVGALWRQAGPGTASRPGWGWPGIDPAVADRLPVSGRHRPASRSRVLTDSEVRKTWAALMGEGDGIGRRPRLVLALSLVTGLRIGALALTRIADVDLDPEPIVGARDNGPTIRVPAEDGRKATAKQRREGADLVLPLSDFAVRLFREALALPHGDGGHVFPGHKGKALAVNTVSLAWAALVEDGKAPAGTVAHDLRRTMRTGLGELDHGGAYEDEERLIGHNVGRGVGKVYDRGRRLARLRPLADAWGARLEQIVSAPPAPLHRLREEA